MRKLNIEFEEKFDKEFSPIITFIKNNPDVFLGIRNNYIDLYVNGGKILELKYYEKEKNV